jgi:hypothetical protein
MGTLQSDYEVAFGRGCQALSRRLLQANDWSNVELVEPTDALAVEQGPHRSRATGQQAAYAPCERADGHSGDRYVASVCVRAIKIL